jgi:hypothetical protein
MAEELDELAPAVPDERTPAAQNESTPTVREGPGGGSAGAESEAEPATASEAEGPAPRSKAVKPARGSEPPAAPNDDLEPMASPAEGEQQPVVPQPAVVGARTKSGSSVSDPAASEAGGSNGFSQPANSRGRSGRRRRRAVRKGTTETADPAAQTTDDTDAGWGEHHDNGTHEQWLEEQRPPHWG